LSRHVRTILRKRAFMSASYSPDPFYNDLVKHGLIVPVSVPGAFGRGAAFEEVLEGFNTLLSVLSQNDRAEVFTFPPVIARSIIEKVEYLDSFPHLCGAVYSFFGNELQAHQLTGRVANGEPWSDLLGMTDVVLNPAACYPVYPSLAGVVPEQGRAITMLNWVFRHEPSAEATRMQAFRVREFVKVGTPEQVLEWRDMWLTRGMKVLTSLGLTAQLEVAADPFFGRGGKMLAANQKEQQLKFEVLVPIISAEHPTACCSINLHQAHFGSNFDIRTIDGAVANSACVGFGMERVVMALFKAHGFEPDKWPAKVRQQLWP
jgi:seryl-tRNA synthetase